MRRGLGVAPVAVNLSTMQFQSRGFVETVAAGAGRRRGAPAASLLELELTERMLMDDLGEVQAPRCCGCKALRHAASRSTTSAPATRRSAT